MRSWIRKIEQSTNSVSSRLSAVEKRITNRVNGESKNNLSGLTIIDGSLDNVVSKLSEGSGEKNLEYIFRVLDKNHIDQISNSIDETNEELIKSRDSNEKSVININERIEKLERQAPPTMKIGSMEIPIEISGITAGSIAIFAALMVAINKTEIITTPAFLAFAGILFIGTTIFKTIKSRHIANSS